LELPRMRKQSRALFTVLLFCSFTLLLFHSITQPLNTQPSTQAFAAGTGLNGLQRIVGNMRCLVRKYTSILIPQPTHGVTATT
jgi:hypothetical protein